MSRQMKSIAAAMLLVISEWNLCSNGASAADAPPLAGRRPNVILIITDDQGYGDLGRHGNEVSSRPLRCRH